MSGSPPGAPTVRLHALTVTYAQPHCYLASKVPNGIKFGRYTGFSPGDGAGACASAVAGAVQVQVADIYIYS